MKVSEITIDDVKNWARVDSADDDKFIQPILDAAKQYVRDYTGLTDEKIDKLPDAWYAVLAICAEMYERRQYTYDKDSKVTEVVASVLAMHSVNYL